MHTAGRKTQPPDPNILENGSSSESSIAQRRNVTLSLLSLILIAAAWAASMEAIPSCVAIKIGLNWSRLALFAIYCILSTILIEPLRAVGLSRPVSYRCSLLISTGAVYTIWLYRWVSSTSPVDLWMLVFSIFGALFGILLATSLRDGLCENSFPPSETIQNAVLQLHQQIIVKPPNLSFQKRLFDIVLSLTGLVISLPVWLLFSFLIWLEDPGPVLFIKNSVGLGGNNFHQLKIRTLTLEAEKDTGPILANEEDSRVLLIGHFLRKTALDELPQLINILKGEMSFVGPRPLRTILVHEFLMEIPEFAERHKVRPGLSGLAQVARGPYISPIEKLNWDRLYLDNAGLYLDLKLLFLAFILVFWLRWVKNVDEELPRRWLGLNI